MIESMTLLMQNYSSLVVIKVFVVLWITPQKKNLSFIQSFIHWFDRIIIQISHCNSHDWSTLYRFNDISLSTIHHSFLWYKIYIITVCTQFKSMFVGLLIHSFIHSFVFILVLNCWNRIESNSNITTNHIPIHFDSLSFILHYHNHVLHS